VQDSYAPNLEKGPSVTDQRQRFVFSFVLAPKPFHRDHELLVMFFNNWKASGVFTYGSGRPVSATVTGDANQDGNNTNDRLPGVSRNSLLGPDYATTDMRLTRRLYAGDRVKLELMVESFNLLNRNNQRVQITQDGFQSNSTQFVQTDKAIGINIFPAQYRVPSSFLRATDAYAPRQIQLALKLIY
jgi:acyl dehydratase